MEDEQRRKCENCKHWDCPSKSDVYIDCGMCLASNGYPRMEYEGRCCSKYEPIEENDDD